MNVPPIPKGLVVTLCLIFTIVIGGLGIAMYTMPADEKPETNQPDETNQKHLSDLQVEVKCLSKKPPQHQNQKKQQHENKRHQ